MKIPRPTPLYRLVHVDNLPTLLARGTIYAPNTTPDDGLPYRTIHNISVQENRRIFTVPCKPNGSVHDYVPFYFGPLSVMLLNLKTGRVEGYNEGQEPLIYLVTDCQIVASEGLQFVFTDGHGLARFTAWYNDISQLKSVDWEIVGARYWSDTMEDNDRQRRKQAEFLVHHSLPWKLIHEIGVLTPHVKEQVEDILDQYSGVHRPDVTVRPEWYYF